MRFADPLMLLLLVTLVPVLWMTGRSSGRILYSNVSGIKRLRGQSSFHPRQLLVVLRALAVLGFVLALARPQAGKTYSEVASEGIDIFLAIDTSGSMQAMDFQLEGKRVTRLEAVKSVAADFIKKRPNDRIGLVVFGSEAYTQCPLTLDHGVLLEFLQTLEIGMAGESTAIGSALGTVVKRMKDLKSKSKVSILLTDGRNEAGSISPEVGADLASTYDVRTYTIGVGTGGQAPFLVPTPFGNRFTYQYVPLDEATLKMIADKTKGQYFKAADTEKLEAVYEEIDELEKTEIKVKEYTEYNELFAWFLLPAILILLGEIVLAQTRLRKIP